MKAKGLVKSTAEGLQNPNDTAIRDALERVVASVTLAASPRLASFLRYIVIATLEGRADRLKGYTVAVEALGRPEDFDPQADPIVRVEAGRLRAALARYYAGPGRDDAVVIDLPRGHYVPVFRRCPGTHRRRLKAIMLQVLAAPKRVHGSKVVWAISITAVITILSVLELLFDIDRLFHGGRTTGLYHAWTIAPAPADARQPKGHALRPGSGMPVVYVQPFETDGTSAERRVSFKELRRKLRDVLARFDEIQIASDPASALAFAGLGLASTANSMLRPDYSVNGTAEYEADGSASLTVRLTDLSDGTIVWSRIFDQFQVSNAIGDDAFVREIAITLAHPYGVIHARERIKSDIAKGDFDPRYRCLLDAFEYGRSFDPDQHVRLRACLKNAIAIDPTFALGYAALARIYLREHLHGYDVRPGSPPALDRALRMAQRAVELKPASARTKQLLSDVHFVRGNVADGLSIGYKALALNPFDMEVLATLGARLVFLGEIEKGMPMLRQAAASLTVRPQWHEFALFLGAYLTGDLATATLHGDQITSERFSLGFVARALCASAAGDHDRALAATDRLVALNPAWGKDPRRQLRRFFASPKMVDRLANDLAAAGLGAIH